MFTELTAPPATRFGPVRLVAETGSTNADLLAMAKTGEPDGSVLVTDHQRAGRGRQARVWHDEPGNSMLVSVLLRPRTDLAPLLPLLAGLAAVDAANAVLDPTGSAPPDDPRRPGLKWPNDVLVPGFGERKLAGILAEAVTVGTDRPDGGSAGRDDHDGLIVVVGTGMNLRWQTPPPSEIAARVVTLTELVGGPVERNHVLDRYLAAFERWLCAHEQGEPVLEAYRSACITIGRDVHFVSAGREYRGRAVGVSEGGTLLLDTGAGERVELSAGDAHHL